MIAWFIIKPFIWSEFVHLIDTDSGVIIFYHSILVFPISAVENEIVRGTKQENIFFLYKNTPNFVQSIQIGEIRYIS